MKSLWKKKWSDFNAPLRTVVEALLRSRAAMWKRYQRCKQERDQCRLEKAEIAAELKRSGMTIDELRLENSRLKAELRIEAARPMRFPDDPSIGTHGYGPLMVSLAVNLGRSVGFRAANRALSIVFESLNIDQKVPDCTTIRIWMKRIGVAQLGRTLDKDKDYVWLVDHSNQIGTDKTLVVLALEVSKMPPPGTALKHEDMIVLAVSPSSNWKTADVREAYKKLTDLHGVPRAIVCDGAPELRDGADFLIKLQEACAEGSACAATDSEVPENAVDAAEPARADSGGAKAEIAGDAAQSPGEEAPRSRTIIIPDLKHKAANFLKARLENCLRFAAFISEMARIRSAIQQTELAHLVPTSPKQKARFMNLGALLRWAALVLWLLDHPEAKAREGVTAERFEEKLGGLRAYADVLPLWLEYQRVLERAVKFANEQGVFKGAAEILRALLKEGLTFELSRKLADELADFVKETEDKLREGERLPMSTEILESSFGLYKQLEKQHSKGGFTSLLAALQALLQKATPQSVKLAFAAVKVKDVGAWVRDNLGETVTSKRQTAYAEHKKALKNATEMAAAA